MPINGPLEARAQELLNALAIAARDGLGHLAWYLTVGPGWGVGTTLVVVYLLTRPLPGRGPGWLRRRDRVRLFPATVKHEMLRRAGGRCESAAFLVWGRCPRAAREADHVFPWSRGGPTRIDNGQVLCRRHNHRKAALRPAWWYITGLQRRRREYFPTGVDVRVNASRRLLPTPAPKVRPDHIML